MKKILHITHTNISSDNRILKEINALSKLDNSVIKGIGISLNEKTVNQHLDKKNIEIETLNLFSKKIFFYPRIINHFFIFFELFSRSIFKIIFFKPNIIHCHDTLVLPIGLFYKCLNKNVTLIYDAHELESNKNGQSKFLEIITKFFEKISWGKIDILISVSNKIIKWYNQTYGEKNSLLIMNSPIFELKNFENKSEYFNTKYNIPRDKKIFIYVGLFSEGRSIEKIIRVFSSNKISSHIVFLGFGPLENLIRKNSNKNKKIHYHSALRHDELVNVISDADYGLCLIENISLSDFYCLPNKLFEYAFAKIPILGSDFPEIKKIINEHDIGVTCNVEDEDSILNKILKLEGSKNKFQFKNLTKLGWQNQENKLIKLYKQL